ncbi:eptidoglycan-binding domain 1 protein LysM-repeat proteins and domains, Carbohydrate-Binding Module Family 50 protein [Thermobacillus xylanilyticus]|uniref:LysM repeat-containing protein n=2 Tax=Thermobacillus TaxID=76632 RepID=L0E9G5_THECK|nr:MULTISPECIES: LysM peptidoglycan-binding domain-containing protein [Thermobacillus]AGA56304.1 LysM repeat-containing protein [Thermobacillus composti KWC4]CAG5076192.1 eptidoglycan-binding domain 1 protein LysM-repeat proteins and domains, Carbohydrate-Binding Module Family 50 protein [Thermobacillus xylanilyticus]
MPISPGTYAVYTVRPGDSPYSIANQFGSSLADLERANALYPPVTDPGLIFPGQKLVVRVPGTSQESTVLHQVTEGDTLFRLAERYSAGVDMLAALNRLEQPDILRVAQLLYIPAFVYEVEAGDSLYRIARRFGSSISELARANASRPGFSPDVLYPGYRLVIPLPSSTNIVVFRPLPGSRIAAGTPLAGSARAFEANVLYRVRDDAGRIVARERAVTAAEGAPAFGAFSAPIAFDAAPGTPAGAIQVYTRSARDGSIQDLVEVPVLF